MQLYSDFQSFQYIIFPIFFVEERGTQGLLADSVVRIIPGSAWGMAHYARVSTLTLSLAPLTLLSSQVLKFQSCVFICIHFDLLFWLPKLLFNLILTLGIITTERRKELIFQRDG